MIKRLLCVSLLLFPVLAYADDWTQLGRDYSRSRQTDEGGIGSGLTQAWTYQLPPAIDIACSPITYGGFVYIGGSDGILRAISISAADADPGNVQPAWTFACGSSISSTPAAWADSICLAGRGGTVFCLDYATGTLIWTSQPLGGHTHSSPIVDAAFVPARIYIGVGYPESKVVALNAENGQVIWAQDDDITGIVSSSVAIGTVAVPNDVIVFNCADGKVIALNSSNGSLRWTYLTSGAMGMNSPVIVGSNVYMVPGDNTECIVKLALADGARQWCRKIVNINDNATFDVVVCGCSGVGGCGPECLIPPAAGRKVIVSSPCKVLAGGVEAIGVTVGNEKLTVVCIRCDTGARLWHRQLDNTLYHTVVSTPASTTGGVVYASGFVNNNLYALDAATGGILAQYGLGQPVLSSPAVGNAKAFIARVDGKLYAFDSNDNRVPGMPTNVQVTPAQVGPSTFNAAVTWDAPVDPAPNSTPQASLRYLVRITYEGTVPRATEEYTTAPGVTSVSVNPPNPLIQGNTTITARVRAIDSQNSASEWSASDSAVVVGDLASLKVRDAQDGGGQEVGNQTFLLGQGTVLWAAGYDADGNYLGDQNVAWSGSGCVAGGLAPAAGPSTQFTANTGGIGTATATVGLVQDSTGTFTVTTGTVASLKLRSAVANGGVEIGDAVLNAGQNMQLWAAGYDAFGNFMGDQEVTWTGLGAASGWVAPLAGTNTTFTAGALGVGSIRGETPAGIVDATGNITVVGGVLASIVIRNAPGGGGAELGSHFMTADQSIQVWAAGYDAFGAYLGDQSVTWTGTGVASGLLAPSVGSGTTFAAGPAGQGMIGADAGGGIVDSTGQITVVPGVLAAIVLRTAPFGGGVVLGPCTVSADAALSIYSAGYDADGNFLADQETSWSGTGVVNQNLSPVTGTSTVFTPVPTGTGTVSALGAGGITGVSGTFTVVAGVPVAVKIRDQASGGGNEVTQLTTAVGTAVQLWLAGYDSDNNFAGDVPGSWSGSGCATGALQPITGSSTTFSANTVGTGTISVAYFGLDAAADVIVTGTAAQPLLVWSGAEPYVDMGASPETVGGGGNVVFMVKYVNADNVGPANIQVWVDMNGDGSISGAEQLQMFEVNVADTDYTDGKEYDRLISIPFFGTLDPHVVGYEFYATAGGVQAVGDPTLGYIGGAWTYSVLVRNNTPSLTWLGAGFFVADGVHPDAAVAPNTFQFVVRYIDADSCTACGLCTQYCPKHHVDEYNEGLSVTRP
ncbi:MAG: PQQ-binding-like beta-propeller repeat protein, partial [Planctomycetota bacterium]|nr:PQQ-binding-like beta-propeller repeat protein [Planctomycetota bacterium]